MSAPPLTVWDRLRYGTLPRLGFLILVVPALTVGGVVSAFALSHVIDDPLLDQQPPSPTAPPG